MSSFDTFEGFRDWLLGMLVTAVLALLGLVRKLDVGEINRRLDKLEAWREEAEKER